MTTEKKYYIPPSAELPEGIPELDPEDNPLGLLPTEHQKTSITQQKKQDIVIEGRKLTISKLMELMQLAQEKRISLASILATL